MTTSISFEELAALVGPVLGVPAERLQPADRLVRDVPVDDVTLGDVHHFACVMGAGHVAPADAVVDVP